MAVGLKVGPIFYKVGTGSFFNSFFSTIAYHLENKKWGSRFPYIMSELYNGKLFENNILKAKEELKTIQEELKSYTPDKIIWDYEDLTKRPPWGDNIAERITDLSNYFWTSDGDDLFRIIFKAFDAGLEIKKDILVHSL